MSISGSVWGKNGAKAHFLGSQDGRFFIGERITNQLWCFSPIPGDGILSKGYQLPTKDRYLYEELIPRTIC